MCVCRSPHLVRAVSVTYTIDAQPQLSRGACVQVVESCASSASGVAREYAPDDADLLDGFMPAGRPQRSRSSSTSTAGPAAGPSPQASSVASEPMAPTGQRIMMEQAAEVVQQAAQGMIGADRLRLWREWLLQVCPLSVHQAVLQCALFTKTAVKMCCW